MHPVLQKLRWLSCAIDFELDIHDNGKNNKLGQLPAVYLKVFCVCEFVGGFLPMMAWLCCQFT